MRQPCERMLAGIADLVTLDDGGRVPEPGALERCTRLQDGAVAVDQGRIVAVGTTAEVEAAWKATERLDCSGRTVVPGFVDAHTHPAFAATRAEEFEWRSEGLDYVEIAERGGGILSSVEAVRAASEEELTAAVGAHLDRMWAHGTMTAECKSGYGLSTEDELKSLRAIHAAAAKSPVEVVTTFLGAHEVPTEFRHSPTQYLDLLCEEMLPAIAESGLARAADIFCEAHVFDLASTRRYCERARELGFALRVHADQLAPLGGAQLAAELGAESADHLERIDEAGIAAIAEAGTYAGLLPAVPHYLRQAHDAPARALIDAGCRWFVATDFNPGSCYTASIPEALHFARIRLRLSALEALAGATCYAADSLALGARKGRIAVGLDADLLVLDLPDLLHLGYGLGENPVHAAIRST